MRPFVGIKLNLGATKAQRSNKKKVAHGLHRKHRAFVLRVGPKQMHNKVALKKAGLRLRNISFCFSIVLQLPGVT